VNNLSHSELIRESTEAFLHGDSSHILLCEGIDDGFYSTIEGLSVKYPEQSYELPCSENAMVGMCLSASAYEVTTLVCLQRVEFALLAIEQLINNSAKNNFLTNNQRNNPCLFRLVVGRGWGQGPSHSQSFESLFAQIPDINVFMPVFPNDSKLIFNHFKEFSYPSISLEHRWIHYCYDTDSSAANINLSSYYVKRGKDLTIVAYSYNVLLAKAIANEFDYFNIGIEVINLFRLSEIDILPISESIGKTGLLMILDLDDRNFSVSSDVLGKLALADSLTKLKKAPVKLANHGTYSPSSPKLSVNYYLNGLDIAEKASELLDLDSKVRDRLMQKVSTIERGVPSDVPNQSFSGPF